MSYPFPLRFLAGRLLIDNQIEEKFCVIENTDDSENSMDNNETPNEIYSSSSNPSSTLGTIEFTIKADQTTFEPEFKLVNTQNLPWHGRDGIKTVMNQLDREKPLNPNQYRCYYILGLPPPPGIISTLSKRFGKNLLERIDSDIGKNKRIYWCILVALSKHVKKSTKIDNTTTFINDSLQSGFGFYTPRTYEILGESISTNCAEICHTF